jgi:hypothetical protein
MSDKVTWEKWNPGKVREATLKELQANGEIVGKFLETEARQRLDAITKPSNRKAVRWRAFLSRWVLGHRVDVDENGVTIRVGMRKGPGKAGAMRGFYIEIGSQKAPATSFLRRTILENKKTILATLMGKK